LNSPRVSYSHRRGFVVHRSRHGPAALVAGDQKRFFGSRLMVYPKL
jgi:hypothetical protein